MVQAYVTLHNLMTVCFCFDGAFMTLYDSFSYCLSISKFQNPTQLFFKNFILFST